MMQFKSSNTSFSGGLKNRGFVGVIENALDRIIIGECSHYPMTFVNYDPILITSNSLPGRIVWLQSSVSVVKANFKFLQTNSRRKSNYYSFVLQYGRKTEEVVSTNTFSILLTLIHQIHCVSFNRSYREAKIAQLVFIWPWVKYFRCPAILSL